MLKAIRLVSFVAALTAALTFSGGAQAVFYSSHFDPIDFLGDGLFEFSDSCLLEDGTYTGAECGARLVSAGIDIMDSSGSGHVTFGESFAIIDLVIFGGELIGVDTGPIGAAFAGPCTGTVCGAPWWIEWSISSSDPVFLFTGSCLPSEFGGPSCIRDTEPVATAFDVDFTRVSGVPEPGTLALFGVALAAGWAVRRRRAPR